MVCLRNICINTLHEGGNLDDDDDDDDDDDNDNINNNYNNNVLSVGSNFGFFDLSYLMDF